MRNHHLLYCTQLINNKCQRSPMTYRVCHTCVFGMWVTGCGDSHPSCGTDTQDGFLPTYMSLTFSRGDDSQIKLQRRAL